MKVLNHNTAHIETLPVGEYDVYYYKKNSYGDNRALKTQVTVTDLQVSQPFPQQQPFQGPSPFNDTKQTKEQDMQSQAEQILKRKETQLTIALQQSKDLLKIQIEKHKIAVKENKETQVNLLHELKVVRRALVVTRHPINKRK